ncbi:hypothetical protein [Orrella sp. 11846]|uniref:hypothetical protein n=1 Tax=Orrella sp. 11846 TaxID=3409913 RepID=UPI003B5BEC51
MTSQVNVKGSFKSGSFGIDFVLSTDFLTRVQDLFASDTASAITNATGILAALGFAANQGCRGLLHVIQWLRGRTIQQIETKSNTAIVHVDGEQLEIQLPILTLFRDVAVREAAQRMLEPLSRQGVEKFYVGTDNLISATITAQQAQWFVAPQAQDKLLVDEIRKIIFSIISLTFKEDNKWRLHDGMSTINAIISDVDFQHKVDRNQINFAKGDILVCDVRVRQWQSAQGAKTDYEVIRVL